MTLRRISILISYFFIGLLAFGTFLDAVGNSIAVVTPLATYLISGLIAFILLFQKQILKRIKIPWDKSKGNIIYLKELRIMPKLILLGVVVLVWIPRFIGQDQGIEKTEPKTALFRADSSYNILLLPFGKDGVCLEENNQYHKQVHKRILSIKKEKGLNIEVKREDTLNCDWVDIEAVREYGDQLDADLVIYGNYEERCDDTTLLNVRYVLLDSLIYNPNTFVEGEEEYTLHDKSSLTELRKGSLTGQPEDVLYWALAMREFNQKGFEKCLSYLHQIKVRDSRPDYFIVYQAMGTSHYYLNQHKDAIDFYSKSLKLNPKQALIYNSRGSSYLHIKDYEKAILDFSTAIERNPRIRDAFLNRGIAQRALGNSGEAINDFSRVIELDPRDAFAYVNRGDELLKLKFFKEAIRDLDKGISLNPQYTKAYLARGVSYGKLKKYKEAIENYDKVLELSPKLVIAYINRGINYTHLNNLLAAKLDFETVLGIDPQHADAFQYRGDISSMEGKYAAAISDYSKAIDLKPRTERVYHKRGTAYLSLGNNVQAMDDLNHAIELNSKFAEAYYNRAMLYLELGDSLKAKSDFKAAELLNTRLGAPIEFDESPIHTQ